MQIATNYVVTCVEDIKALPWEEIDTAYYHLLQEAVTDYILYYCKNKREAALAMQTELKYSNGTKYTLKECQELLKLELRELAAGGSVPKHYKI